MARYKEIKMETIIKTTLICFNNTKKKILFYI